MSLRRSARVQALEVPGATANSSSTSEAMPATQPPKKRARKSDTSKGEPTSAKEAAANGVSTSPRASDNMKAPVPTPPRKRKKANGETPVKAPPFTPTPSAVGFMTAKTPQVSQTSSISFWSSGDIDESAAPPTERPAEPHRTNAPLQEPSDHHIIPPFSNHEEASPSKPPAPTTTTTGLLNEAIAHILKVDPNLKPLLDAHHCRVFSPEGLAEQIDPFRSLASGIMAQQVSGAAASSIKNKFINLFSASAGDNYAGPPHFPPPAMVAKTDIPTLRTAGLSQRKAEYIQGLAQKFVSGELSTQMLMTGTDDEVMEKLVAVRGLGRWSVEMFMCFGLKRADVFSTGDLGVQRGMAAYVGRDVAKLKAKGGGKWKYMSEKDMLEIAERFAPYRSLFMWYMWRIEDAPTNVDAVQNA